MLLPSPVAEEFRTEQIVSVTHFFDFNCPGVVAEVVVLWFLGPVLGKGNCGKSHRLAIGRIQQHCTDYILGINFRREKESGE